MEMSATSQPTRRARLVLTYNGKDISTDIAPYVLSFSYTDNAHGKADDLQVKLEDREHLWKGDWFPEKGAKLVASILCESWDSPEAKPVIMACGTFTLDEIELSGPPDTVSIKAVSAAMTTSIRQQKKTKAWENASLKQVAQDIADSNGLQLKYDGKDFPFSRMDQRETSDLGFLQRMAEERGMNLKIADDTIVLMNAQGYDAKDTVRTITRGTQAIKSFRFKHKTQGVYGKGTKLAFHDPATKQTRSYGYDPKGAGADRNNINRRLDIYEDGNSIAAAETRGKNKHESEASLSLMGDPNLRATMTIELSGFKRFDATYAIETATHAFDRSSGYTTELKLRKVLGY